MGFTTFLKLKVPMLKNTETCFFTLSYPVDLAYEAVSKKIESLSSKQKTCVLAAMFLTIKQYKLPILQELDSSLKLNSSWAPFNKLFLFP